MTLLSNFRQVPLLLHISTAPRNAPGCADQSSFGVAAGSAA